MERLVKVELKKVHILSILDCCCRLFPLIYISYDSEGITIQGPAVPGDPLHRGPTVPVGSCEEWRVLATTVIPRDSFEHYECKESMVLAVPYHLGKLGGGCVSIEVLKMENWRVKNVFKSNNGAFYEVISSYMYKLYNHPKITEGISFER